MLRLSAALLVSLALAGCADYQTDKTVDSSGLKRKPLTHLKAGIWVDPTGCDHWIIDDGAEGYLSARLDKYGKPVCSGIAPPNTATDIFEAVPYVTEELRGL